MGVVHRATRADGAIAAVKLLDAAPTDPGIRQRFDREARILARLDHPGIARFIASGVAVTRSGDRPWLAMQWIEGVTLEQWAASATVSVNARVDLLAGIAAAVAHAHARGVVHRDLKPANVMVRADGRPCVLDFGVAGLVPGADPAGQELTRPGTLVGTVRWMSPEQVLADPRRVGRAADVHALGLLAWWLLCGRLPYALDDGALADTLVRIATAPRDALAAALPNAPGGLARLVDAAVAVPPRARPTAAVMADDLGRIAAGRPPVPRMRPLGAAVTALLAGAVGFGGWVIAPRLALHGAAYERAGTCQRAIAHAEASLADAGAEDARLLRSAALLTEAIEGEAALAPAEEQSLLRRLAAERLRIGLRLAELRVEDSAFAELDAQWARVHAAVLADGEQAWPWWWRAARPELPVTSAASGRLGVRVLRRRAVADVPRAWIRAATMRLEALERNAARTPPPHTSAAAAWSAEAGELAAWDAAWRGDPAAARRALGRVLGARRTMPPRAPAHMRATVHAHAGAAWLALASLRPGEAAQDSAIVALRAALAFPELRADPWLESMTWFHLADALTEVARQRPDTLDATRDLAAASAVLARSRYAPQIGDWPRWLSRSMQRQAALELMAAAASRDPGAFSELLRIERGHGVHSGREVLDRPAEFSGARVEADACDALSRMAGTAYWRARTAQALDWLIAHGDASERPGELAMLERRRRALTADTAPGPSPR